MEAEVTIIITKSVWEVVTKIAVGTVGSKIQIKYSAHELRAIV